MNKNTNPFKVGDAVIYKAPNGDSISATIKHSDATCVYVEWFPRYAQSHTAMVLKADFGRLTPFNGSKFLAIC